MHRIAAAVLVAVSLVGCGGGSDDQAASPAPTTPATSTAAPAPATFDVNAALLTLADLPIGWVQDKATDGGLCQTGIYDQATTHAKAQFSDQGGLPQLEQSIGAYPPGGAAAAINQARAKLDGCDQVEQDGNTWTVTPTAFPTLGDDSFAYLATTEIQGITVTGLLTAARHGDAISAVVYGDTAPIDTAAAKKYARLSYQRMVTAQAG